MPAKGAVLSVKVLIFALVPFGPRGAPRAGRALRPLRARRAEHGRAGLARVALRVRCPAPGRPGSSVSVKVPKNGGVAPGNMALVAVPAGTMPLITREPSARSLTSALERSSVNCGVLRS